MSRPVGRIALEMNRSKIETRTPFSSWSCVCLCLIGCVEPTTVDLLPARDAPSIGGTSAVGTSTSSGRSSAAAGTALSASGGSSASLGGTAASGGTAEPAGTFATSGAGATTVLGSLPAELIHRWDFSGSGVEVIDRIDGRAATILGGAELDGSGRLSISDGVSYVALPSAVLSSADSSSMTIAAWITWFGGASWQRVFDFGRTAAGDGLPGEATAQFYFTPRFEPRQFYSVLLDGDYTSSGQAVVESTEEFPANVPAFVAVVVEGNDATGTSSLRLYLNGARVGTPSTTAVRLAEFPDQNCWLGQSQWIQDADPLTHWNGQYDEFRIYSRALSDSEISNLSLSDPSRL